MKKIVALLLMLTAFAPVLQAEEAGYQSPETVEGTRTIALQEAKNLHQQGVLFVDVRSDRQYNKRHIAGALHLYIKTQFTEANLLEHAQKNDPIVIYCNGAHCALSYKAATLAVAWGFRNILYYRDGFRAWRLDGNPLQYGPERGSLAGNEAEQAS